MRTTKRLSMFFKNAILSLVGAVQLIATATPLAYGTERPVYLTFDDGPSLTYTPQILDILLHAHVPATFFVLGQRAQDHPETMIRIRREGHEIGNHGFYHTSLVNKSEDWIKTDVHKADMAITLACGIKPLYFRPPGGLLSKSDGAIVRNMGHQIALWSLDTQDWKAQNAESIFSTVKKKVHPGSIILMHDGVSSSRYTVKALPSIIQFLKANGYRILPLPTQYRGH